MKRKTEWIALNIDLYQHPKIAKAGPAAAWVWACCIMYCQRYLTDGFIPKDRIEGIAAVINPSPKVYVKTLLACRLLDEAEGGYPVHDYLDYNDDAATVKRKRKLEAARRERHAAAREARV